MPDNQTQTTKVLKVRYYLTLVGETELEIPEGKDEGEAVRAFLPDVPARQCIC